MKLEYHENMDIFLSPENDIEYQIDVDILSRYFLNCGHNNARTKNCIYLYHFKENMTYRKIGKLYNISGIRIMQIIFAGFWKIRRYSVTKEIKYWLDNYWRRWHL